MQAGSDLSERLGGISARAHDYLSIYERDSDPMK